MKQTSQPIELLMSLRRDGTRTLGRQIEEQIRGAIRDGALRPAARVPSTRDLSRQLGVSRQTVVDAYAQLAAEGYLSLRQGARPRVADGVVPAVRRSAPGAPCASLPRFDFRPSVPDVSTFPRASWLRSLRRTMGMITDADLEYGDARGVLPLRSALAAYLGRVRGVSADPADMVITAGYTQGVFLVCRHLAARGARRVAVEDPCNPEQRQIVARAGLETVPVPVDGDGILVDQLGDADAVVLTPAHQHPTGALLGAERRTALLTWLAERDALAIEDDYDAEYRYDRASVGALQGLAPDRVVYAGSTSKTLAPALRLAWLVLPPALTETVTAEKALADLGSPRIDQLAMADFLERGELDRHLRRMRQTYRARRDELVAALADELPEASVHGIAAGLHVTVELPYGLEETRIQAAAAERRIALSAMADYGALEIDRPPTLMLGYGKIAEPSIRPGIREIAAIIKGS